MNSVGLATACRHELYSGYKGQRPPMPPELSQAIPRVREVLKVLPTCCALETPMRSAAYLAASCWTNSNTAHAFPYLNHADSCMTCPLHKGCMRRW